ncbi:hypothetical protein [Streptomyces subrutilus]|uniref:Uncharacterized protein n=1 Tax=Streptomyces subrutilus TaxID=36818 RepID=A0A1E5PLY1_9ACTN|nr:hypothetical protein [Streptomyces subrutilus]OEJ30372.1 hypothetical protein BGK67_02495 [Streptomyces subrutilus]
MKRHARALVAGILGALIVFGGFAIEWNVSADPCNGTVMREGDRCVDLTSGGSYDPDDPALLQPIKHAVRANRGQHT